ncbi:MAG: hypothetical protein IJ689_07785 [Alphaproteobacteria bacterium]|nr:hypothetical protein [Alphaproteobacteria bacterium]MBR1649475.1 hypothetical protein [Alphaproteobacteria bacterium]
MIDYQKATDIANCEDVTSRPDSVVLYSISYLKSNANKIAALEYVAAHPSATMIDQTPCGKKLIELGLDAADLSNEDKMLATEIWKIASRRFIQSAKGNITAFVNNADPRSVFRSLELPEILKNPDIKTVNGVDKTKFRAW